MLKSACALSKPKGLNKENVYYLKTEGERRCVENRFYGQQNPGHRGYTEKIFRALNIFGPSTAPEIKSHVKEYYGVEIHSSAIYGTLAWNIQSGYIGIRKLTM